MPNKRFHASFLSAARSLPSVANSTSAPVADGCPNDVPQISSKFSRFCTEMRIPLRVDRSRIAAHFRIAQFPHWNTSFPQIPDLRLFRAVNPRIAAQRRHRFAVIDSDLYMGHRPADRAGKRDRRNQQTDRHREQESFHRITPFIKALGYRDAHEGRFVVVFNDSSGGLKTKEGGSIAETEPPWTGRDMTDRQSYAAFSSVASTAAEASSLARRAAISASNSAFVGFLTADLAFASAGFFPALEWTGAF